MFILVNGASPVYIGLFGYASSATIKNIDINSGSVNVTTNNTRLYTGSIVGYGTSITIDSCKNNATINISNTGSNTGYYTDAGGIIGYVTNNASYIKNSINKAPINYKFTSSSTNGYNFYTRIGGIVGHLQYADISGCANLGEIIVDGNSYYKAHNYYIGGIVGYGAGASGNPVIIENSYNRPDIKTYNYGQGGYNSTMNVGGIIGYINGNYHTIRYCYNRGNIYPEIWSSNSNSNATYVAGISGYVPATTNTFTSCYNTGQVPSTYTASSLANNNSTKNYNHDCMVYNPNNYAYNSSSLFYNSDSCGCTKNQNNAGSVSDYIFKSNSMPGSLGSTYYKKDVAPYFNNGYPILKNGIYQPQVETSAITDTNAMSATIVGLIDMQAVGSYVTETGFEYKIYGGSSYTKILVSDKNFKGHKSESQSQYLCG